MRKYLTIPFTLIAGLSLFLSCKEKNPLDATNHPPEITLFTYEQTVRASGQTGIVLESIDLDGDSITVTAAVENGSITWAKQTHTTDDITRLRWEGTYRPDTLGNTSINVCVSDGMKEKTYQYPVAIVANVPPHAQYVCSLLTQTAPYIVQFDASASYDSDGEIVSWHWDFGDTTVQGRTTAHHYPNAQDYSVTLVVEDNEGLTDTLTDTLTFTNQKPHPVIEAPITEACAPCTLWFDGRNSYDEDGSIISWTWEWDDGTGDSHKDADWHIFENSGDYSVDLRIIDNAHAESTATTLVTVNPSPPVALIEADVASGHAPLYLVFHGGGSYDPDGIVTNYTWDVSGPSKEQGSMGERAYSKHTSLRYLQLDSTYACTLDQVGIHTTTLIVEDDETPPLADTTTFQIKVLPASLHPVAKIEIVGPESPHTNTGCTFSGQGSYDPDGSIVSWRWELRFPDFTDTVLPSTNSSQPYTWKYVGNHQVTLILEDNDQLIDTATALLTVQNYNPVAVISIMDIVYPADSVKYTFSADSSSDRDAHDILTFAWSSTDGGSGTEPAFIHTFACSSTHFVTLRVTDPHNGIGIDTYMVEPPSKSAPPAGTSSRR
jgi:PKD repeat protein